MTASSHTSHKPHKTDLDGMDNLDVAMRARELADDASPGSLRQAAAGSVAVACATTRDLKEARMALEGVNPAHVRDAALDLLDRLSA